MFLNLDSSFNIKHTLLTFSVVVLGITMEGTVSQIFYLGPSFCFMYEKCMKNNCQKIHFLTYYLNFFIQSCA